MSAVPVVSLSGANGVMEGEAVGVTLTASPAPIAPLTVNLLVSQTGDFVAAGGLGAQNVTIPKTGSAVWSIATVDEAADEPGGSLTVELTAGKGYRVAAKPPAIATKLRQGVGGGVDEQTDVPGPNASASTQAEKPLASAVLQEAHWSRLSFSRLQTQRVWPKEQ